MSNTTPSGTHVQPSLSSQPLQPLQPPHKASSTAASSVAVTAITDKLAMANEQAWLSLGNLAEMMTQWARAVAHYKSALKHNANSIVALSRVAALYQAQEQYERAIKYYKRVLSLKENHGETWSALGHCYMMMDHLPEAYNAYQQALSHLSNPKDPKLWYEIGILYDRYGSLENAEEAFSAVIRMDAGFDKVNEIYFRLGIIYKQQQRYDLSLQCFRHILRSPPRPLTEVDIWFQTGNVYEHQGEFELAKDAYERVLAENPNDAKVLQQVGWLYHHPNTCFFNQAKAIDYLTRSIKADSNDAQSFYLLGRCYMDEKNYQKAYEAYQQAVYRDSGNPTFWRSIGVLYFQINQPNDALDAYNRAIRLNPYFSEVWFDLGMLYESRTNQVQDAIDAYKHAAELDPNNMEIRRRIDYLQKAQRPAASIPFNVIDSKKPPSVPRDAGDHQRRKSNSNNTNDAVSPVGQTVPSSAVPLSVAPSLSPSPAAVPTRQPNTNTVFLDPLASRELPMPNFASTEPRPTAYPPVERLVSRKSPPFSAAPVPTQTATHSPVLDAHAPQRPEPSPQPTSSSSPQTTQLLPTPPVARDGNTEKLTEETTHNHYVAMPSAKPATSPSPTPPSPVVNTRTSPIPDKLPPGKDLPMKGTKRALPDSDVSLVTKRLIADYESSSSRESTPTPSTTSGHLQSHPPAAPTATATL